MHIQKKIKGEQRRSSPWTLQETGNGAARGGVLVVWEGYQGGPRELRHK